MIKYTRMVRTRPPWVCAQCLGQPPRRPFFWRATASTEPAEAGGRSSEVPLSVSVSLSSGPAAHSTGDAQHDDATLRAIFDKPEAWAAFARTAAGAGSGQRVGLFGNAYLTEPRGFLAFTQASLERAQRLVTKVAAARTRAQYRAVVRDLDQLSDVLCRVIDLCDFVRANPPDGATQQAAAAAWATTYQYMNQLNTTTALNEQLGRAMGDAAVAAGWSEEERTVAALLRLDFTKSAVDLPQAARDRFVALSQRISEVGTRFVDAMAPAQAYVDLPSTACRGLDPLVARQHARQGGRVVRLPSVGGDAALALRSVADEGVRRTLFCAGRTASAASVARLEELVTLRAELARLAGFDSYAHMALRDRMMARSPESVLRFLDALAGRSAPRVRAEVADLTAAKRHATHAATAHLRPWDRDYYMTGLRRTPMPLGQPLSHYFSLGTVMQGLSRLFQRLYGLRLVPRATPPGETWHDEVRRLDVVSDTDGHVAVLYCDLFYRADKSPNPAHFTVRCSRAIAGEEVATQDFDSSLFASPEAAANDGMATARDHTGQLHQLPTIALVCDFARVTPDRPALLSFHEVETLFHEMGHAVHSVLARTGLQTVAGTRCATDLAELPSTLMEQFAADPSVLALFARHYDTDAPVDYAQVAAGLQRARRFAGLDDAHQIVLAQLDQACHGPAVAPGFDSTGAFFALQERAAAATGMPVDPAGTCWQGFFGHLFGYGSTYYSYLFDRVLADRVWRVVFAGGQHGGALRRDNGEHLRDSLLRWGGGRDPWHCVSDALRDDRIAQGDEEAMALVGSWGTSYNIRGG